MPQTAAVRMSASPAGGNRSSRANRQKTFGIITDSLKRVGEPSGAVWCHADTPTACYISRPPISCCCSGWACSGCGAWMLALFWPSP